MKATYHKYILHFKVPSGTSRGILKTKETWFLNLNKDGETGIGECGLFRGLSIDDRPDYEKKLKWVCNNIGLGLDILLSKTNDFPSIQIGIEQAFLSLHSSSPFKLFFKDGTTQQDIIKAIKKQRIDECYNYDAMLGKVTNFTWKFNDDGSYDIDLNLIGLGDIIETLKVNTTNAANLKKDPTPTQVRTKKKSAIDSQKTKIADKKTKAPLAAEAVNKGFEDALVSYNSSKLAQKISQNYSTAFTTAKNTNDTSVPLFENSTLINASILAQFNNLNTNSDLKGLANTAQQAIPEIEAFITEAGPGPEGNAALVAKLTPIIPSLRTLIKSLNNLSILKGNSAKAEDTAKASQAEADAELKALEGALQSVAKEEEIAQLSPETSVESKNKTALNLQLYNWRQEASKGLDKDNLLKLTFVANSSNPTSTGASTLNLNFYYVRLGYLLKWIQENLLYYDPTKKAGDDAGMDNKKLGNPIFTIDLF